MAIKRPLPFLSQSDLQIIIFCQICNFIKLDWYSIIIFQIFLSFKKIPKLFKLKIKNPI